MYGISVAAEPAFGTDPFGAVEGGVAELETHVKTEQDDAEVEAEAEAPVGGKAAGKIVHVEAAFGVLGGAAVDSPDITYIGEAGA